MQIVVNEFEFVELGDQLDKDELFMIGCGDVYENGVVFINKDDAIKIIEHLKQVFELEDK